MGREIIACLACKKEFTKDQAEEITGEVHIPTHCLGWDRRKW